jgi:hypothetical protein
LQGSKSRGKVENQKRLTYAHLQASLPPFHLERHFLRNKKDMRNGKGWMWRWERNQARKRGERKRGSRE